MNVAKEIYKQLVRHCGEPKNIKGLTPTQRKAFREGYANPTISSVKSIFLENGMDAVIEIKSEKTSATIKF